MDSHQDQKEFFWFFILRCSLISIKIQPELEIVQNCAIIHDKIGQDRQSMNYIGTAFVSDLCHK